MVVRLAPLCALLLLLGGCREQPGECSGDAGRLCVRVTLGSGVGAPERVRVEAITDETPERKVTEDVPAAEPFRARGRLVVEIDLAKATGAREVIVNLTGFQGGTATSFG